MSQSPKLLDQVRELFPIKHYALRTEQAYVNWIRRYILCHDKRHPREMGVAEVRAFLAHLAVEKHVSASTQTQALRVTVQRSPRVWYDAGYNRRASGSVAGRSGGVAA